MNLYELRRMVRHIDDLIRPGDRVQIETSGDGYEVTVFYWHPTEHRDTHFHVQGATLPEAINRARATSVEVTGVVPSNGTTSATDSEKGNG